MGDGDATSMRSLGRLFGRMRSGFLEGLRGESGGHDGDGAVRGADTPPGAPSARENGGVRVVATRTTVVEEVQIIEPERR